MKGSTFNYARFVAGWRAIAADHGIDPISGQYNYADDAGWWMKDPLMWADAGPAASCVERDAIASIAAQARAAHGLAEPRTLADTVQEAWREDGASRSRQLVMPLVPLRDLHKRRGMEVADVAGQRMIVPIRQPA